MTGHAVGLVIILTLVCGMVWAAPIVIDGNFDDWTDVTAKVEDPQDMADSSGDVKLIQAAYADGYLYLRMTVHGIFAPTVDQTPEGMNNRYYYHWILDTDNNADTGFNNSEYEGNATNVSPIGVDVVVMIGWRDGALNGLEVYDPLTETMFAEDFKFAIDGDSAEAAVGLDITGAKYGTSIMVSGFQEGASNDWQVDWLEPMTLELKSPSTAVQPSDKLTTTWGELRSH